MKKFYIIIVSLSILFFLRDSLGADMNASFAKDNRLTLVVGNRREATKDGETEEPIFPKNKPDFTHTNSFEGSVVSVDISSLKPPLKLKYPHLTIDFAIASSEKILFGLNNIRPTRVLFEWFPSCRIRRRGQIITPLLLPALKNAFAILLPGGELIIDHSPYTLTLPDIPLDAIRALVAKSQNKNIKYVKQCVKSPESLKEPGIISHILQMADPFTLHMCNREKMEIRNYLTFKFKNPRFNYIDDSCKFINGKDKDINSIVSRLSGVLGMEENELMSRITDGSFDSSQGVRKKNQGYWDLFEQHYYMKTRGPLILQALRDIGFSVEHDAIRFHDENPYNQRKHAWIISAIKPVEKK